MIYYAIIYLMQERYNEIVAEVCKRLKLIRRFEAAAELYESIEAADQESSAPNRAPQVLRLLSVFRWASAQAGEAFAHSLQGK